MTQQGLATYKNSRVFFENVEGVLGEYMQIAERVNNALSLEGLSPLKEYINRRLQIIVRHNFNAAIYGHDRLCTVIVHEQPTSNHLFPTGHDHDGFIEVEDASAADQDLMLINDVQFMQVIKVSALPFRKRLYFFEDDIPNFLAGPLTGFYCIID